MSRQEGYRNVASYLADGAEALGSLDVAGAVYIGGATEIGAQLQLNANLVAVDASFSADLTMGAGAQILADPGTLGAPGYAYVGDTDNGMYRSAADVNNFVASSGNRMIHSASGCFVYVPAFIESKMMLKEIAAPTGTASYATVFAVDDGTKTDLKVIFQSGAAIIIEQEA